MKNLIGIIVLFSSLCSYAHKTDSIGTRVKNGKTYILHQVEKGDGLYSLSRKYNISLKSIINENPGSDEVIKIDDIVWIPTDIQSSVQDKVVSDFFSNNSVLQESNIKNDPLRSNGVSTFAKYHKVVPGETLYSISVKYNTKVEMIKNLNNLTSNELTVGQRLLVQDGQAKTVFVSSDTTDSIVSSIDVEISSDSSYKDQEFETQVETKTIKDNSGYSIKVERLKEYDIEKIEENGTAMLDDPQIPSDKNFAYHFNAPIGQVIMVTNPINKKTIFVKVIGNFEKEENSSLIIKLSDISAKSIDLKNNERVMLSYAIAQ